MYYKKVEITGVNTAKLPVLSDAEREELIRCMKAGSKKARDTLVMSNLKLILSVIQKINNKNIDPDDLFQVGCVGLIKALKNFDPELNVQFSTYGVVMILGEIKRYIRDNNSLRISRSTKDLAYSALSFKERYIRANDTEPTVKDIADALGTSTFRLSSALEAITPAVSLYEPVFNDDAEGVYLMDCIMEEDFVDGFCSKTIIMEVLHNLKKREKHIMNLRYLQGKTQTEVARTIGISQAQVSRIEKSVLAAIKKQLNA